MGTPMTYRRGSIYATVLLLLGSSLACGNDGHKSNNAYDPCDGVTCSEHGSCYVDNNQAACDCDDQTHADGLACVENGPGEDALLWFSDPDPTYALTARTASGAGRCAASSGNRVYAVWTDNRDHFHDAMLGIMHFGRIAVSNDNGLTFSESIAFLPVPEATHIHYFQNWRPSLAVDSASQRLYIATEWEHDSKQIFVVSSSNGAESFSSPSQVSGTHLSPYVPDGQDPIWPSIAVGSQGRVFVAWVSQNEHTISTGLGSAWLSYSDDHGVTFSTPMEINDREQLGTAAPIAVVTNGEAVHIVGLFGDIAGTDSGGLIVFTSLDNGETLARSTRVSTTGGSASAALDSSTGQLVLGYCDSSPQAGVCLARSADLGESFSVTCELSQPASGCIETSVAAMSSGAVAIAWTYRDENKNTEIYTTWSFGEEQGFQPPVRVNDATENGQYSPCVAATATDSFWIGWTDERMCVSAKQQGNNSVCDAAVYYDILLL